MLFRFPLTYVYIQRENVPVDTPEGAWTKTSQLYLNRLVDIASSLFFSIQHATKKHLAHGFEKLHNYDNQRPRENRGNKKSVTRFSRRFARTRPASNAVETFSRTDAFIYSCVYFVCLSMITRVAAWINSIMKYVFTQEMEY